MKNFISFVLFVFVPFVSVAEVQHVALGPGKVIAFEQIINNPEGPTLIMLPGVNRALTLSDASIQYLSEAGWNLLMPSLPAHPLSVEGLNRGERPYFTLDNTIRVSHFAKDIEELVAVLNVGQAIPVTLSYSSSVGAYLNPSRFPHVIDTVPLIVSTEDNPMAAKSAELWEGWLKLNPFMAPFWIRQFRDQAYSQYWGQIVDVNLASNAGYYGKSPQVANIKAGYVSIARAVEDFDFMKWDFSAEKRTRDFVFAGSENSERMRNQIATLENYLKTGKPVRVVVIKKAGHVLPSEKPKLYADVLTMLATNSRVAPVQFTMVDEQDDLSQLQWGDREELEQWMSEAQ